MSSPIRTALQITKFGDPDAPGEGLFGLCANGHEASAARLAARTLASALR